MDPVGNGFPGAAGGALGRILQSKGGVPSTSLACQIGEISPHITCFTSPAYCLESVSSTSAPASQKVSLRKDPPIILTVCCCSSLLPLLSPSSSS